MPVTGIRSHRSQMVEFRWRTPRVLVTCCYLFLSASTALLYLKKILKIGISAKNMGRNYGECERSQHVAILQYYVSVGLVFFSCSFFCCLLFLFLAQRWRELVIFWERQELVFLGPPYKRQGWMLSTKIRLTAALFFTLALRK